MNRQTLIFLWNTSPYLIESGVQRSESEWFNGLENDLKKKSFKRRHFIAVFNLMVGWEYLILLREIFGIIQGKEKKYFFIKDELNIYIYLYINN